MWRSIVIYNRKTLSIKHNSLVVKNENDVKEIPLEDINCIVFDNLETSITTYTLSKLAEHNIVLLTCDEKHMPCYYSVSYNLNYHLYKVFKMQNSLTKQFKDQLWAKIIKQKIINQAIVLNKCNFEQSLVDQLLNHAQLVINGDKENREGICAKLFFRNMYGSNFIRHNDDAVNIALNYGYSILRSMIAKMLAGYGFTCYLGLHHISETNAYNLVDDLIEPFRPLIDEFVNNNINELVYPISKEIKNGLINILNIEIIMDGKVMKVRYAVDYMVKSLYSAIENHDIELLILPEMYDK